MTSFNPGSRRAEALQLLIEAQALVDEMLPQLVARRNEVQWKPDGSPVTTADILLEGELTRMFRSRLPDVVVVGEESFGDQVDLVSQNWVAVIDPIDGTENFCSGLKEWGVSISLWREGAHQASLLLLPELRESLRTGEIIERSSSRIVGLSSSLPPAVVAEVGGAEEVRVMGCAVYNLYNVSKGSYKRFFNPKGAYAWDLLAGLNIALEQGCSVSVEGESYSGEYLPAHRRYRFDIRN